MYRLVVIDNANIKTMLNMYVFHIFLSSSLSHFSSCTIQSQHKTFVCISIAKQIWPNKQVETSTRCSNTSSVLTFPLQEQPE